MEGEYLRVLEWTATEEKKEFIAVPAVTAHRIRVDTHSFSRYNQASYCIGPNFFIV